jgi:hypothetical protein
VRPKLFDPTPGVERRVPSTLGVMVDGGTPGQVKAVTVEGRTITARILGIPVAAAEAVNVVVLPADQGGKAFVMSATGNYPTTFPRRLSSWGAKYRASTALRQILEGNPKRRRYRPVVIRSYDPVTKVATFEGGSAPVMFGAGPAMLSPGDVAPLFIPPTGALTAKPVTPGSTITAFASIPHVVHVVGNWLDDDPDNPHWDPATGEGLDPEPTGFTARRLVTVRCTGSFYYAGVLSLDGAYLWTYSETPSGRLQKFNAETGALLATIATDQASCWTGYWHQHDDADIVTMVGFRGASGARQSLDGGATWATRSENAGTSCYGFANGALILPYFEGATVGWKSSFPPHDEPYQLGTTPMHSFTAVDNIGKVSFAALSKTEALMVFPKASGSAVFRVQDDGSYVEVSVPPACGRASIVPISNEKWLLVSSDEGQSYVTENAGAAWSAISIDTPILSFRSTRHAGGAVAFGIDASAATGSIASVKPMICKFPAEAPYTPVVITPTGAAVPWLFRAQSIQNTRAVAAFYATSADLVSGSEVDFSTIVYEPVT